MKNKLWQESVLSLGLITLGILVLNPFEVWMPDYAMLFVAVLGLVLFGFLGAFVLRERVIDERDEVERSFAGRVAFLVGSGTLLCGILVQGYFHAVDPWLVVALALMLFAKIGARIYSDWTL